MSIKNAPPRWSEIAAIAEACGAGHWAMRKWLARCEIPATWKLQIVERSNGELKLADLEIAGRRANRPAKFAGLATTAPEAAE